MGKMNRAKVLIIEDERIVALDLKNKLVKLGYEVINLLSSGEKALEYLETEIPDLILMDIMLNGELDGILTASIIKEKFHVPFIFISALSDEGTIHRAKFTEPYGYIVKPFSERELKTTIQIALHKSEIEKKLVESELKYRALFYSATDAVITHDEDGIITSVNLSAVKLFGYKEEDLVKMEIKKLLPDIFINHLKKGVDRFVNKGVSIIGNAIELKGKKSNGDIFPIELSYSQWELNKKFQYTLIIRDVSKRKQQEKQLKDSKLLLEQMVDERTEELKALIEQSTFPICVYDKDGSIVDINNAFRNVWRIIYPEVSIENYILKKDKVFSYYNLYGDIKKIFKKGGKYSSKPIYFDVEENGKFNEGIVFRFHFYSVKNKHNKIFRIVCILENVTTEFKAEEIKSELELKQKHAILFLERIEEERKRISRELHDEIGAILYTAKCNLDIFEQQNNKKIREISNTKYLIDKAGVELKGIIHQLHPVAIDNYGLKAAIKKLSDEIRSCGIQVNFDSDFLAKRYDKNIELNIYRIVQEAFTNIKKHSRASEVTISFYENENLFVIIKDNGIGFNEFENYSDETLSSEKVNEKGMIVCAEKKETFGLINMQERAKNINGSLSIESEPGKGTVIILEVPVEYGESGNE